MAVGGIKNLLKSPINNFTLILDWTEMLEWKHLGLLFQNPSSNTLKSLEVDGTESGADKRGGKGDNAPPL